MNPDEISSQFKQMVEVHCEDRWQVYHRLQELEIPCKCTCYQPLNVQINSALTAVQLWSVVRQVTAPRSVLVQWLENCWRSRNSRRRN